MTRHSGDADDELSTYIAVRADYVRMLNQRQRKSDARLSHLSRAHRSALLTVWASVWRRISQSFID